MIFLPPPVQFQTFAWLLRNSLDQGPWCNWQHVNLSSWKVRVRIPSGPRRPWFCRELAERLRTGASPIPKSYIDLWGLAFDNGFVDWTG